MLIANAKASLGWFAHLFAQPLAQLIFFSTALSSQQADSCLFK